MSAPRWSVEGRDWPNREHSRFLTAGGVDWHVQVAGTGPDILLIHGTGGATHSWRDVLPLLAREHRVIAPDLPGHGFSGPLAAPTLPAVARAVAALLAGLDAAPAAAAGHSAGAAILVRMALDGVLPGPLVSFGGALLPFPGPAATVFPALAKLLFLNPVVPRLFAFQAGFPNVANRFLARSTGSILDARGSDLYARLFATSRHCEAALALMANWDLAALRRDLPRLANPLLLVHGDGDASVPADTSRQVAALIPGARLCILPNLGHLGHEEDPAQAAALIAATLPQEQPCPTVSV